MTERHYAYEQENNYLQDILAYLRTYNAEIEAQKGETDAQVSYSLKHYNADNADQFIELTYNIDRQEILNRKVLDTRYALRKPYFARVDFTPDDTKTEQRLYIGKMTLMRELTMLIVDWRAPVSSLYYEGRLGRAGYESLDGVIEGEITLKRQFVIENAALTGITDIDITTNDTFLQAALGASKDRRLKDIVTTIQAEQNRVIRAELFAPLVVQGVAGGGKTTIALHRIAYLLYNYAQNLKPRQVMIMAPNRFFLSYISEVLPDLGVEHVTQTTFEDFAAACVGLNAKRWTVNPALLTLAQAVNSGQYTSRAMQVAKLKGDLGFMALVQRYCGVIAARCIPETGFFFEGYELFTHEAVTDLFLREYKYLPVAKRAAEIKKHLVFVLKQEKPRIIAQIEAECDQRWLAIKQAMPDGPERQQILTALFKDRDDRVKRTKYKASTAIRPYMALFKMDDLMTYYQGLFTDTALLAQVGADWFSDGELRLIAAHTTDTLQAKKLDTDDLPPLMFMQARLFGLADDLAVKHIVIDEAQDFSMFQFAILKTLTRSESFSVLGDIHQGIYGYKGVDDWQAVIAAIFPNANQKGRVQYLTLEQSYRTTVEIMNAANPVIRRLYGDSAPVIPLAKPVIRHGAPVELVSWPDAAALAAAVDKKITACQADGCQSIAIIAKTLSACQSLQKRLQKKWPLITGDEAQYQGGILIVPSYLAKGLEFDAVIITDAEQYNENEALDIKLLYIAMTRALHRLTVYSEGPYTALLSAAKP